METGQVAADLTRQKYLLQGVKEQFKGQRATNKISRGELLHRFSPEQEPRIRKQQLFRTCQITHVYPPSTTLLSDLKPISISELLLETRHTGRVLIVRTFGHPLRSQPVQNAVEDSSLDVDQLVIYDASPKVAAVHVLPKNAIFAIKEPYYTTSESLGHAIRVDHPSDLHRLKPTHPMVPRQLALKISKVKQDALSLKNIGNTAFKAKDYPRASAAYTEALSVRDEDEDGLKHDLYRNRSIVNIYLQRYELAAQDAISALLPNAGEDEKKVKDNVKALYRAGRAFYGLENFSEAQSQFEQLLQISPGDKDGEEQLARTRARIKEARAGDYDFPAMSNSVSDTHKRLDHASFTANVEIRAAGQKGRGLFATKDIKVGELILVEKAFAVAFASEMDTEEHWIVNNKTNTVRSGTNAILFYELVQKMLHNPTQAQRVLDLSDGGYSPKSTAQTVDGALTIDTFHAAAIMGHNCYGCADTISENESSERKTWSAQGRARISVGVWVVGSYFNHSCLANARRSFMGDCLIVRATRNIAKDEELFLTYHNPHSVDSDHVEFQNTLSKVWHFTCECEICTAEAASSPTLFNERQRLVREAKAFRDDHRDLHRYYHDSATIAKAEELYAKLKATYDGDLFKNVPKIPLVRLGEWLSAVYYQTSPQKAIDGFSRVLCDLGHEHGVKTKTQTLRIGYSHSLLDVSAVYAAMYMAKVWNFYKKTSLARQYVLFARERHRILYGEVQKFHDTYGEWSKPLYEEVQQPWLKGNANDDDGKGPVKRDQDGAK